MGDEAVPRITWVVIAAVLSGIAVAVFGSSDGGLVLDIPVICPLLSGPKSVLDLATKEEWNGAETQAGGDYRQAA